MIHRIVQILTICELSNEVLSYTGSSTPASLMSYKTQTKIKPLIDSDVTDINKVRHDTLSLHRMLSRDRQLLEIGSSSR